MTVNQFITSIRKCFGVHNRLGKWYCRVATPDVLRENGESQETMQMGELPLDNRSWAIQLLLHDIAKRFFRIPDDSKLLFTDDELRNAPRELLNAAWEILFERLSRKTPIRSMERTMQKYGLFKLRDDWSTYHRRFTKLVWYDPEYIEAWDAFLGTTVFRAPKQRAYGKVQPMRLLQITNDASPRAGRLVDACNHIKFHPRKRSARLPRTYQFVWKDVMGKYLIVTAQSVENARTVAIATYPILAGAPALNAQPLLVAGEYAHTVDSLSLSTVPS